MSAWGKTGRVVLSDVVDPGVWVDGHRAGYIGQRGEVWVASDWWRNAHLPSSDAAILWVLRRVDPALWRQERGEVWRVRTYKYARGWHAIDPEDGQCQGCLRDFPSTIARAHKLATRRAATR